MTNPYKNQHAECCNASFAYWEYLPTCRYCSREICGEKSCIVPGSLDDSNDGRPTFVCTDPECVAWWEDDQKPKPHQDVLLTNQVYPYPHKTEVFQVETLYPYRLSYIHANGQPDGCVRYCSTVEKLQAAEKASHRSFTSEHFENGTWNAIKTAEVAL